MVRTDALSALSRPSITGALGVRNPSVPPRVRGVLPSRPPGGGRAHDRAVDRRSTVLGLHGEVRIFISYIKFTRAPTILWEALEK